MTNKCGWNSLGYMSWLNTPPFKYLMSQRRKQFKIVSRLIQPLTQWHDQSGPVLLVLLEDDGHLAVLVGDRVQLRAVAVQDEVAQLHKLVVQRDSD